MIEFQPFADRVLVARVEAKTITESGLHVPTKEAERTRPHHATVLAVGEQINGELVEVGDVVAYSRFAGTDVRVGDKDLTILEFNDLLGKVVGG